MLMSKYNKRHRSELKDSNEQGTEERLFPDKTLNAALDSFDNLFCRRCLVSSSFIPFLHEVIIDFLMRVAMN